MEDDTMSCSYINDDETPEYVTGYSEWYRLYYQNYHDTYVTNAHLNPCPAPKKKRMHKRISKERLEKIRRRLSFENEHKMDCD